VGAGHWRLGLRASAAMELVAFALSQYVLWFAGGRGRRTSGRAKLPRSLTSWLVLTGFIGLGLALLLNFVVSMDVAGRAKLPVYPPAADRTLLLIALWGFAAPVAWGYSSRFASVFLGLEEPRQRFAGWLAAGVAAVSL